MLELTGGGQGRLNPRVDFPAGQSGSRTPRAGKGCTRWPLPYHGRDSCWVFALRTQGELGLLCTHGMVAFRVFPKAGAFSGALGLPCESSALTQQILQDVLGKAAGGSSQGWAVPAAGGSSLPALLPVHSQPAPEERCSQGCPDAPDTGRVHS